MGFEENATVLSYIYIDIYNIISICFGGSTLEERNPQNRFGSCACRHYTAMLFRTLRGGEGKHENFRTYCLLITKLYVPTLPL